MTTRGNDDDAPRKIIGRTVLRPRQQVEETIKAAILSGELKSGEMLPPEAELARQFNVSRTTLREAWRAQFFHYGAAFRIGAANRARGFRPSGLRAMYRHWKNQRRLMAAYPMND